MLGDQTIAELIRTGREYADALFKPSLEQFGGLFADTAGLWKLRNRVRVMKKATAFLQENGVAPAKLLPNVFVPLVEEAGNTDDETLSDMFARLLASHLDQAKQGVVHPAFAKVLGQLSPLDAKLLNVVDEFNRRRASAEGLEKDQFILLNDVDVVREAKRVLGDSVTVEEITVSLSNLERLGLCDNADWAWTENPAPDDPGLSIAGFRVKTFGVRLLIACSPSAAYWRRPLPWKMDERFQEIEARRGTPDDAWYNDVPDLNRREDLDHDGWNTPIGRRYSAPPPKRPNAFIDGRHTG